MPKKRDKQKEKADVGEHAERYSSHADYIQLIQEDVTARQATIEIALREAFAAFIERREVEVIVFSSMDVLALAAAIENHPLILKALLASCNLAGRAIERDLGIKNLDTYLEFPMKSGQGVNGYSASSYSAGETYPSDECRRWLL